MDYQEKLRLAKEALNSSSYDKRTIEYIFPELKENKDEMIRNFLISKMKEVGNVWKEYSSKDIIAWLEKQGEKKPFDYENANIQQKDFAPKGKPKFKAGDWVVPNNGEPSVSRVEERGWPDSIISDSLGNQYVNTFTLDKQYHLWTIKDAKDGDILYTSSSASHETFIFKGLSKEGNIECYCSYDSEDKYCEGKYHFIGKPSFMTHPATKEQRAILFQRMKEAGYEWDAEKNELKKVESKSAWSEDDEKHYQGCLHVMNLVLNAKPYPYYNDYLWLKSIKDRILPQPKSTWSEEDEHCIELLLPIIDSSSLIPKNRKKCKNFLKSLKDRYIWKPSDEQMNFLWKYAEQNNYDGAVLTSLFRDLKKLKEE